MDFEESRIICAPLEEAKVLSSSNTLEEIKPEIEDTRYKPGFYGQAKYFLEIIKDNKKIGWPACSIKESLDDIRIAEDLTLKCLLKN